MHLWNIAAPCCCPSPSPNPSPSPSSQVCFTGCAEVRRKWRVVISGVTTLSPITGCDPCEDYNGTFDFDLSHCSSDCRSLIPITGTSVGDLILVFQISGSSSSISFALYFNTINVGGFGDDCSTSTVNQCAKYGVAYSVPDNCLIDSVTMNLAASPQACSNLPATITATAI